jgi:hypothetical protein
MAKARPSVKRVPVTSAPSTSTVSVGGVKVTVPPAVAGDAIDDDDLCDCGHAYGVAHPGSSRCRFAATCRCVGFIPR